MSQELIVINILPDGKEIKVARGSCLLDVLISAGIGIESVCGGAGECGKCKILVNTSDHPKEIPISKEELRFLSEDELKNGIRLACRQAVDSNLYVTIPDGSRTGIHQILTVSQEQAPGRIDPFCRKIIVELIPPTLSDNTSDFGRLKAAIEDISGTKNISIAHGVLKHLSSTLRKNDWKICATVYESGCSSEIIAVEPEGKPKALFGLAVDIGTTTVVASLVDLGTGITVDVASDYNRQISCGEDVIARINFSEEENGLHELNRLVLETMNGIAGDLVKRNGLDSGDIACCVVAGNTTMAHLFYNLDPRHIRTEPYIPTSSHMPVLSASELGVHINKCAPIISLPGRASYVGGDITADILAAGMHRESGLCLLIDVGTNGEVVLGGSDWLVGCSCSAGPAFEGGEVACGTRATAGAIERVRLSGKRNLTVKYSTIGGLPPIGICGSGLIDLVAELFLHGILDKGGRIQDTGSNRVREGKRGREFVVALADETCTGKSIAISDVDLKNIIRTKGAVYSACAVLLKKMNFTFDKIEKIFIAGGFGNYIDAEKAVRIGLLPDVPRERFRFIGNGSLGGARLVLLSREKSSEADEIVKKMTYIDLSTDSTFFDEYSSSLFLPHTDMDRFPSVRKMLDKK